MPQLDSLQDRCIEALAAFTRQLALPGIPDTSVVVRTTYDETAQQLPAIVFTYEGPNEERSDTQTWETVDVWYATQVYIAARLEMNNDPARRQIMGWREAMVGARGAFHQLAGLENVPECGDVTIDYGAVAKWDLPKYATVQSAFTVKFLCRIVKLAESNRVQQGPLS